MSMILVCGRGTTNDSGGPALRIKYLESLDALRDMLVADEKWTYRPDLSAETVDGCCHMFIKDPPFLLLAQIVGMFYTDLSEERFFELVVDDAYMTIEQMGEWVEALANG